MKSGEIKMIGNLPLKADPSCPLTINVQLKEQFKWLIGMDVIKSGDILPPANHLADQLYLNRNTIQWVYSQLREEGLVTVQKGRGTQVVDSSKINEFKRKNRHFDFVRDMLEKAVQSGFDPESLLLSGFAYIQLFSSVAPNSTKILFVECKQSNCFFYMDEIKKMTDAEVFTLDLSDPEPVRTSAVQSANIVVTTLDHLESVKTFVDIKQKPILTVGTTEDIIFMLSTLKQKT